MGHIFSYERQHLKDAPQRSSNISRVHLTWENHNENSFSVPEYFLYPWVEINPKHIISKAKVESNVWSSFKGPDDLPWVNRIIHGDSLCGMASLVKSGWANCIQMIYFDPPFGINYQASFELAGEMTEGYQDKWEHGLGSYLEYMRQRLVLCRDLLHPSGSIFVQIGETNMHYVRCILDEIFGAENAVSVITFRTAVSTNNIKSVADYLLWYAKDQSQMKRKQLCTERSEENLAGTFTYSDKDVNTGEKRFFKPQEIVTRLKSKQLKSPKIFPIQVGEENFLPPVGFEWKWDKAAMAHLVQIGRVAVINGKLYGKRFIDDFPDMLLTNIWTDTSTSTFAARKHYTVKTNPKVIRRCIAATSDYGDIVLDPTSGSGTTAYVAEEMERRWIVFDTSPSAVLLAMSWLLSTNYPIYKHTSNPDDLVYQSIPQFSISDLAQKRPLKQAVRYDLPKILKKEGRVASIFQIFGLEYNSHDSSFDPQNFNTYIMKILNKNGVISSKNAIIKVENSHFVKLFTVDSHQIGLWDANYAAKTVLLCCLPPINLNASFLSKILTKMKSLLREDTSLWILCTSFSPDCRNIQQNWKNELPSQDLQFILIHPDLLMHELTHSTHPEAFRVLLPPTEIEEFAVAGFWDIIEKSLYPSISTLFLDFYLDYLSPSLKSDIGLPINEISQSGLGSFIKSKSQKYPFFIDKRGTWHF